MRKEIFMKNADEVENVCPYFIQKQVSLYLFIISLSKKLNDWKISLGLYG
jgi:hypothetical protein